MSLFCSIRLAQDMQNSLSQGTRDYNLTKPRSFFEELRLITRHRSHKELPRPPTPQNKEIPKTKGTTNY